MKRGFLIFTCAALCSLCFVGCGQETQPQHDKAEYSYSMNALTVAVERSYAKAVGGQSDAVLSPEYLNGIPQSFNPPEYTHFTASYLKALTITRITAFTVSGNYGNDLIYKYCGDDPYRIIIADYLTEEKCVRATWNETEYALNYFDYVSTEESTVILIEGNDGLLTAYTNDGKCDYDEEHNLITQVCEFAVGYAKGIAINEVNKINGAYSINYSVDYTDNGFSFKTVQGNDCVNNYALENGSLKHYDINDYYAVSELVLPQWYAETEEKK